MQSIVLLVAVGLLIGIPGTGAVLAFFGPGDLAPVTRVAAVFGLGYAATAGCAFALAAAHVFWLASFLPLWFVVTAVLWWLALRRFSLREQGRALWTDIVRDRVPLLLGAVVVLGMIIVKLSFLHIAPGPHYVYYLNGIEIANSHGVPAQTLEYGQSWAPATDKIFLDAFTGVLPLLGSNPLVGPGVLLLLSYIGAAVGLWASAWELGLRRTGALLPLLLIANLRFLGPGMAAGFDVYRDENVGIAVASCTLALGIVAIREGGWRRAAVGGTMLAAASGTHLVPVVIVVFVLTSVGVAELMRGGAGRTRLVILREGLALAGVGGVIGLVIRIFAGGTFGLGGASSQDSYNVVKTWFDPTEYLYTGYFASRNPSERHHLFVPGRQVLTGVMQPATGTTWKTAACLAVLAGALVVAVLLFVAFRDELGTVGIAGVGTLGFILVLCLGFSFYYHVWIDATFGIRRMSTYDSLGLVLVGLGLAEAVLLLVDRTRTRLSLDQVREKLSLAEVRAKIAVQGSALAIAPVAALTAWVAPTSLPADSISQPTSLGPQSVKLESNELVTFANWVRASTPCGSRFLVDQRPEGTMTSLTGRFDLSEGMGSFLRPGTLPYVTNLMLSARAFYEHPQQNEAFLRQHHINYVVASSVDHVIGYPGPIGPYQDSLNGVPFLRRVWSNGTVTVYQVRNSPTLPVSPLLQGPYLHCGTSRIGF